MNGTYKDLRLEKNVLDNGRPTIALLLGTLSSSFHEGIIRGASRAAKEKGYNIVTFAGGPFYSHLPGTTPREKIFDIVDISMFDGVVLTASSHFRYTSLEETDAYLKRLSAVPVINISGDYNHVTNVYADFEIGFDKLFDHYVNIHGYKRIAFFRGPKNHGTSERRMKVYLDMLDKYGLEYDEQLIVYGDLDKNAASFFVEEFFDRRKAKCDAIISINDLSTIEIMHLLEERGIKVPEDIAISGSMGIVEGLFTKPKLTTIKEPVFELGAIAINILSKIFNGEDVSSNYVVPTELIIRESCGCTKKIYENKVFHDFNYAKKIPNYSPIESVFEALRENCFNQFVPHFNLTREEEIEDVLSHYKEALSTGEYIEFIKILEGHLIKNLRYEDISLWLSLVSEIQYSTYQLIGIENLKIDVKDFGEMLLFLIEDIQQQTINFKKYETNFYLQFIQDIGNKLNTPFALNTIKSYIINMLESNDCYISTCETTDKGEKIARNLLTIHNKEQLTLEDPYKVYSALELVPQSISMDEEPYNLIVFPLLTKDEMLGFMVIDYKHKKGNAYENMQSIISATLKNEMQIQELKEAEARFSDIAHSTSDWLWEIDEQNRFIYSSNSVKDVMGYSKEQILGKSIEEIAISGERNYLDAFSEHSTLTNEEFYSIDVDGNMLYLLISATPIEVEDVFKGYRGVFKNITQQKIQEERIRSLAFYDILTGLPNRTMFQEKLDSIIQESADIGGKFALFFLDIDRFKYINDTLGHPMGDLLLQKISEILKTEMGHRHILSRLGGDEFTIIVKNYESIQDVVKVIQGIYEALKQKIMLKQREVYVSLSIGVAIYPIDGEDSVSLIKNSDTAMYRAKGSGRNKAVFYDHNIEIENIDRINQEAQLYDSIKNNRFVIEYQPQVIADTGKIIGAEALVRMLDSEGELIYPGAFIPLAEEINVIGQIDSWVIEEVSKQLLRWKEAGVVPINISINLSPIELKNRNLAKRYISIIEKYNIDIANIQMEITENALIENESVAIEIIREFKEKGIKIAMDDFGVGHSSLKSINLLPIDTVKIDRLFIEHAENDNKSLGIIKTIVFMANNLGMNIVAEGVETQKQYELMKKLKCQYIQGYYFSKPISVDKLTKMIRNQE